MVKDLQLGVRTVAALHKNGVYTISDLERVLPKVHLLINVGPRSAQEVRAVYSNWKESQT